MLRVRGEIVSLIVLRNVRGDLAVKDGRALNSLWVTLLSLNLNNGRKDTDFVKFVQINKHEAMPSWYMSNTIVQCDKSRSS